MWRPRDRGVSEALQARLAALDGDAVVPLVVLLARPKHRRRGYERAADALVAWLDERGGRVLRGPDILGALLVEAPASVVLELAEHDAVEALVENQPVGPLR